MAPRHQWTRRHQQEDGRKQRTRSTLVISCADDTLLARQARHQRQDGAPEHDGDDADEEQVLQRERALPRHRRRGFHVRFEPARPERKQTDGKQQAGTEEAKEPRTDRADRECMHRRNDPAAHDESAEHDQQEGEDDEPEVPSSQAPATLLHLRRVQVGRRRKPGHQRDVLDRVPAPVAAPAENVIRPPHA